MKNIINETVKFVKSRLADAEGGHDWFHTERVWKLAKKIQKREGGNLLIIELGALLHDVADPKFHGGDEDLALKIAGEFLADQDIEPGVRNAVLFIIKYISFKNRSEVPENLPLELKIVQDADRLDAMGAIGIARTFNFGGFKGNLMFHPDIKPDANQSKENYKKSDGTTINHFYEKLLLLRDLLNTETARETGTERHEFMLRFLDEFYREWNVDED